MEETSMEETVIPTPVAAKGSSKQNNNNNNTHPVSGGGVKKPIAHKSNNLFGSNNINRKPRDPNAPKPEKVMSKEVLMKTFKFGSKAGPTEPFSIKNKSLEPRTKNKTSEAEDPPLSEEAMKKKIAKWGGNAFKSTCTKSEAIKRKMPGYNCYYICTDGRNNTKIGHTTDMRKFLQQDMETVLDRYEADSGYADGKHMKQSIGDVIKWGIEFDSRGQSKRDYVPPIQSKPTSRRRSTSSGGGGEETKKQATEEYDADVEDKSIVAKPAATLVKPLKKRGVKKPTENEKTVTPVAGKQKGVAVKTSGGGKDEEEFNSEESDAEMENGDGDESGEAAVDEDEEKDEPVKETKKKPTVSAPPLKTDDSKKRKREDAIAAAATKEKKKEEEPLQPKKKQKTKK